MVILDNSRTLGAFERQSRILHNPNIIQGFVQNFIEDFKPDYYYEISVTDVEGYTPTFIEYYAWDENEDGPIPGIKLFKDFNIYLEREYCEY